jgi:hypothetical protein
MTAPPTDRFEKARAVADAVLYEGYVLYPYRASSRKNQARFQWGVLTPRAFSEADGSERWTMRTECVVAPGPAATLWVRVRCLQAQRRSSEAWTGDAFVPVDALEVEGVVHVAWDEAVDQMVELPPVRLPALAAAPVVWAFSFDGGTDHEPIRDGAGAVAGRLVRRRQRIDGVVRLEVGPAEPGARFSKVTVTVENATRWTGGGRHRDDARGHSLIAVHTMLAVDGGTFVSLLDPPVDAQAAASACHSEGAFPVLIGEDDVVLSSPIILYDHPEVAAESPGDLYDSLEIDEILALRVMTLTEAEKSEAHGTDPRAAAIIERCDDMTAETLSQLHGQMRPVGSPAPAQAATAEAPGAVPWWDPEVDASFDPWTETVWVAGVEITKGSRVRLRPSHRADAHDIFLDGMDATVAGVFSDVDGDQHVAVTVDDDPATEALTWQGRFLFFHPDEVEPRVDQGRERVQ